MNSGGASDEQRSLDEWWRRERHKTRWKDGTAADMEEKDVDTNMAVDSVRWR